MGSQIMTIRTNSLLATNGTIHTFPAGRLCALGNGMFCHRNRLGFFQNRITKRTLYARSHAGGRTGCFHGGNNLFLMLATGVVVLTEGTEIILVISMSLFCGVGTACHYTANTVLIRIHRGIGTGLMGFLCRNCLSTADCTGICRKAGIIK